MNNFSSNKDKSDSFSEQIFFSMIENINDSIWSIDNNYRLLTFNSFFAGSLYDEFKVKAECGMNVIEYLPKDVKICWTDLYKRALGGEKITTEQKCDNRYFELSLTQIFENGNITGLIIFKRDITKRKENEIKLFESEERFRKLSEISFEGIAIHENGIITDVNQTMADIFGYTISELRGMSALDLVNPESEELAIHNIQNGYDKPYEVKGRRKDGSVFPLEALGKNIVYQGKNLRVASLRNIADRKKAEEDLKESEEKFRRAFDYAAIGMALVAPEGKFIKVNKALCKITGYSEKELLTKTFQNITHPDDLEKDLVYSGQLLTGEIETYQMEKRYLHKNGHFIWILLSGSLVRDIHNHPLYFIAQIQDITNRKINEKELLLKNKKLAFANEELDSFAYIASHDLQEPLMSITSYMNLLSRKENLLSDNDSQSLINAAMDSSEQMKKLIHDLLLYSRSGMLNEPKVVDCNLVLKDVFSNLHTIIEEKEAKITYDSLPVINAENLRIQQLFQNLIGNALKYHKKNINPEIHISSFRKEGKIIFSVKDNGIGIPEEYFEIVFKVFKRLHKRSEYPGTGIGLAICKRIVEKLNGNIWVKSSPGNGSVFYFSIPAEVL